MGREWKAAKPDKNEKKKGNLEKSLNHKKVQFRDDRGGKERFLRNGMVEESRKVQRHLGETGRKDGRREYQCKGVHGVRKEGGRRTPRCGPAGRTLWDSFTAGHYPRCRIGAERNKRILIDEGEGYKKRKVLVLVISWDERERKATMKSGNDGLEPIR